MAIHFDVMRDGNRFAIRVDGGTIIPIASKVRYRNKAGIERFGLSNDGKNFGSAEAKRSLYLANDYQTIFPFWCDFIEPTAICEGQSYISLNTYDRARFTFGFGQFAAHVPDGDFVRWLRDMLQRPEAFNYFPNLTISGGRIVKVELGKSIALENDTSTKPLQLYLNPSLNDVEDAEVVAAAKLIHWMNNYPQAKMLQVQHMINTAKSLVREADRRLGLDGIGADLCCIIMDVRHQGRAGYDELQAALNMSKPYSALLNVGAFGQPDRVRNLAAALGPRRTVLKVKKWSRSSGDFV